MEFRIEEIGDRVRPADEEERRQASRAIRAFARPRLSGTEWAAAVADEVRRRFLELGYETRELPFAFSTWPGRFGLPVAGALYLTGTLAAAALILAGRGTQALAALAATPAALNLLARYARSALATLPWGRVATANWLVHRPGARPRFLIVAHRDSKSQSISTYLRIAAIGIALWSWSVLLALALSAAFNPEWHWPPLVYGSAALALAGGGLILLCRTGNDSPGALDNATGLAALLGLARREREHDDVAFLVTDGEELGLAGAHAVARRLPRGLEIINLDGLDDDGSFHVVERFGLPRRGYAPHLAAALLSAAAALQYPIERRNVPIGLLVDHIAFVQAGHTAVTLMRGSARSLRRVHRPEDDPSHLTGRGIARAVALVSGALALLRGHAAVG